MLPLSGLQSKKIIINDNRCFTIIENNNFSICATLIVYAGDSSRTYIGLTNKIIKHNIKI